MGPTRCPRRPVRLETLPDVEAILQVLPKSTPVTIWPALLNSTGSTPIGPSAVIVRPLVGVQPTGGICAMR